MADSTVERLLAAVHHSADRLSSTSRSLTAEQVSGPSYDDGWPIAQVASHLGSQAEIFRLWLQAGEQSTAAPGGDVMQSVWARWDAKSAVEQVRDGMVADTALLERVDAMSEEERGGWRLDLFGSERDLAGLLRMRLSEHALHTWDIVVMLEPAATVTDDAVELIVDDLPGVALRAGKPSTVSQTVAVATTSPERSFRLDLGLDGAHLNPGASHAGESQADVASAASIELPAEALVRLVYGRLDPAHTPASVQTRGVDLDVIRAAFPGL